MRSRRDQAALVTDAAQSRDEEFAARKRRYVLMMLARVVFLIAACVLVRWTVVGALTLAVVGTLTPWFAVMMANDGPPKNSRRMVKARLAAAERTLETGSRSAEQSGRVIEAGRVIDSTVTEEPTRRFV